MYNQSAQWASRRRRARPPRPAERGRRPAPRSRERVRLIQLGVCLALFLAVFVGRGASPASRMAQLQQRLQTVLTADTDFRAAFSALGEALSGQGPILGELGEFCIQVFGAEGGLPEGAEDYAAEAAFQAEQDFLNRPAGIPEQAAHYLRLDQVPEDWLALPQAAAPAQVQEKPAAPAVGTVILRADYTGPALPENYTMDQISLGELQTVTPLLGHLRSTYGYRDHPVDGEYKFHNGVDIGGQEGDTIGAFADGTVDYIGENDTHGLYLQLDHGNGIKSFYAHCSKLCVSKGQLVAAGEKVAEVGSTGVATGPHLHLELKWNGLHLDPSYYVEFLSV